MYPSRFAFCLLVASMLFVPLGATSASTPSSQKNARIEHILAQQAKLQHIPAVALSHDGKHLAWLVKHGEATKLMLAAGDGTHAQAVDLPEACRAQALRWSPDSHKLAVLTRCKVDPSNSKPLRGGIWLVAANGDKAPRKVTDLTGYANSLQWSPDGTHILFLYVPGATRLATATASGNRRVGVIGQHTVRTQRIARLALTGGKPQLLTPKGLYAYEFELAPDGKRLAFTAAPPPGDNNWWTAKLYVQSAKADAEPRLAVDPGKASGSLHGLQVALPRWAPDDKHILFIGGLMSDRGATGGDIYRVAATGKDLVNLTAGAPVTSSWFAFLDAQQLLVSQIKDGHVRLATYALADNAAKKQRVLFTAAGRLGDGTAALAVSLSAGPDHTIAYAADSFDHPPEVHVGKLGTEPAPAVTSINAELTRDWGKARSVQWQRGEFSIQGWLLYPANFDANGADLSKADADKADLAKADADKTWPMIVSVHGGPTWANLSHWGSRATALSEFGYFVFLPNPRGSFGAGEAFTLAIRKQMGHADLDDILAGVDKVEKIAPVDNDRLGMTGWSYGGFMSMFAPTQTDRFKAVVVGAGLSNWQSYYGENRIDQWMIPFFGASVYDDPEVYAKSSAIHFIKQTDTPALIVVGERDEETPAPQSFEYWHALKTLGVPTTLVVYADQGHHITGREDQEDILRRTLDWFHKYLSPDAD